MAAVFPLAGCLNRSPANFLSRPERPDGTGLGAAFGAVPFSDSTPHPPLDETPRAGVPRQCLGENCTLVIAWKTQD